MKRSRKFWRKLFRDCRLKRRIYAPVAPVTTATASSAKYW